MGFLSKLFSCKEVEEVAEEIVKTYADEVQANTLSKSAEPSDTAEVENELVHMLEVTESGDIEFTENAETEQDILLPQEEVQTAELSDVQKHIITFRVNDAELAAINRRYE